MLTGMNPAFGRCGERVTQTVLIQFTVATNVVTFTKQPPSGFAIADFASGEAVISWPKELDVVWGMGQLDTDSDTASSRRDLRLYGQDYTAGTGNLRCVAPDDATDTTSPDGTYTLLLVCGD